MSRQLGRVSTSEEYQFTQKCDAEFPCCCGSVADEFVDTRSLGLDHYDRGAFSRLLFNVERVLWDFDLQRRPNDHRSLALKCKGGVPSLNIVP